MINFELDYESTTHDSFSHFRSNVSAANAWLDGMSRAALEARMPVLWCMSTPRYVMQSMRYPSVTAARWVSEWVSESLVGE